MTLTIYLELKAGEDRKKSISGPTTKRQTYSEEKLIALAEAFALSDICTGRTGKIPATANDFSIAVVPNASYPIAPSTKKGKKFKQNEINKGRTTNLDPIF